jgi:hypothetical protein
MKVEASGRGRWLQISDAGTPPGVVTELLAYDGASCAKGGPPFRVISCGGVPAHLVAFVPDELWPGVLEILRAYSPHSARKLKRQFNEEGERHHGGKEEDGEAEGVAGAGAKAEQEG